MVLVDTSVWIEHFRRGSRLELGAFVELDEIVTCPPIVQEVLQGFSDPPAYQVAREAMLAFPIVESPLAIEVFLAAVDLFRRARRAGQTVRSSIDCLIAACAVRNSLTVLHRDRDFEALARVAMFEARRI